MRKCGLFQVFVASHYGETFGIKQLNIMGSITQTIDDTNTQCMLKIKLIKLDGKLEVLKRIFHNFPIFWICRSR